MAGDPMAAKKKSKKAKKKTTTRRGRKSRPRITITGTMEALKDLAVDVSKIPGVIIKRVGF
jgi:hypothetical protein